MHLRAMSFVGFHNSGKTTLVVRLAGYLRDRGHRVGIIKSSGHGFDLGGTDTGKLAGTGCPTAGLGPDQAMVLLPRRVSLHSALPFLDGDILLVEGGKSLTCLPRIILPKRAQDIESLDSRLAFGYWDAGQGCDCRPWSRFGELAELAALVLEKGFLLPGLDCGACGRENCAALAREIVAGRATAQDCRAESSHLEILVNGVPLGMNSFVASIMASTIRGMLSQLKGYAPGRIEIKVEGP